MLAVLYEYIVFFSNKIVLNRQILPQSTVVVSSVKVEKYSLRVH